MLNAYPRLVGDIGGTNARFGLIPASGSAPQAIDTLACADYATPAAAIRHYLAQHRTAPRWAAIGIANPVHGDSIRMTNHHWGFSIEALRRELGLEVLLVLNDWAAMALSLVTPQAVGLEAIGGGRAVAEAPKALIGPGTGLGVSALVPYPGGRVPLAGEGGHVTLPAQTAEERAVIACLGTQYPHVSAERLLSGPGLSLLHTALARVHDRPAEPMTAAQITTAALAGDARGKATVDMFCAWLGTVAGDLALTLGARGGVYIGGGIVPRLGVLFGQSPFRQRFESKGRFRAYLSAIPTYVIHAATPALAGCAVALDNALARPLESTPCPSVV